MSPEIYRRQRELFLEALKLPPSRRAAFLDEECGADRELRSRVESLLEHHDPNTLIDSGTPSPATGSWRARWGRLRRWSLRVGLPVVVLGALVALGFWTDRGLRRSVLAMRGNALAQVRDASVAGLREWVEGRLRMVEILADDPRISGPAARLVASAQQPGASGAGLLAQPAHQALDAMVEPFFTDEADEANGLCIYDRNGTIVYSARGDEEGRRLAPEGIFRIQPVLRGEPSFAPPLRGSQWMEVGSDRPPNIDGIAAVGAPIRDDEGRVVAGLCLGFVAQRVLSHLLAAGRLGETGETYAFDEDGIMLSASRFDALLRDRGLLPDDREILAASVELRDPGRPLAVGTELPEDLASQPLTRPVALALASRRLGPGEWHGTLTKPYRSYRGVESVGAWAWLEDLHLGVVTEIELDEALAPMHYLEVMFQLLIGAVALLLAGVLVATGRSARLRRRLSRMQSLGRYDIERIIGGGGMGEVMLARHRVLGRPTAVKVIRPDRVSPETLERFEREVKLASQLSHPNTIEIYDYGRTESGVFYYAMEYVDGPDLAELVVTDGALPPSRAIHILIQICSSLREVHDRGLVHRDIKPQNVMLCERGGEPDVVKVLDFGIVKQVDTTHSLDARSLLGVRGSPLYMAPERLSNPVDIDARVDLYAVGAVAYELLAARPILRRGESDLDLLYRVAEERPRPLGEVAGQPIPARLDQLVMRCLEKDRERRPRGITEILEELSELALEWPWQREEWVRWWRQKRGAA